MSKVPAVRSWRSAAAASGALLAGLLALGMQGICGVARAAGQEAAPAEAQEVAPAPAVSVEPAAATGAVHDLLYARPFALEQPYPYTWMREQPGIVAGQILVLEVDPEFARPRQTGVAVLFAGGVPAHLTNTGYPSGRMIVIVPDWVDPLSAPFFFGSRELPERIDRARGAVELAAAAGQGAAPFSAEVVAAARAAGGERARWRDSVALFRAVADLIDAYAPDEHELAEIYRTPLVGE